MIVLVASSTSTTAPPEEVTLPRLTPQVLYAGYAALVRTRWTSAWLYAAAWAIFGAAFAGAIAVVAIGFRSSPGSVLLVLAAGSSLARYLGETLGTAQFLRWTLDAAGRLAWLEDYARQHRGASSARVPDRLTNPGSLRCRSRTHSAAGAGFCCTHCDRPRGTNVNTPIKRRWYVV